ncbi:MAG: hypothetical protein AAB224_09910 [Gemmatimonadota bacterium]
MSDAIDEVLDKLAKDVELAVHALYRGEVRQATAKARTGHLVRDAASALRARAATSAVPDPSGTASARHPATAPSVAGAALGWTREDGEAVMKCVTAWLPMGSPASAAPDSKCISSGREMVPTWGERERARAALRKLTPS